ncbi:geranylgeranyl reductase family protein [Candidatus Methanoperedens nitroreducens]|uniref:Geranylgeranyl reductase family protein n=1 Tax=Candidatus Methanoperedens nitratireducens TaxID=1392998 RepID=A0A062UUH1_9EURY|nr:NAD(P)/FAD-dependent oxidoreductase [Candidatus Methanoperedens nitroreducens]KCZ70681.1 geranylgeranyl reductase family protein [Candidatus Methanoperedens nitroreducens]MDJ1420534.1 NAD(P)/FAD-dependent oxidoreductase [Candidatus Methanoperedens sp.]
MKYDVVVVGAGPAGAIASKYAARAGARTLLIEEHASIGSPTQCTGLISKAALVECEIGEGSFILSKMKGAFVYAPGGEELTVRGKDTKAYVIDRKIFDRALVERSLDQGVDILLKTRFIDMNGGRISVIAEGEQREIHADIIIGADGIQSSVGRAAGIPRCKKFLSGIQFEAPYTAKDPEFVEIFTGNDIAPGFFAWAVPFGGIARIGLARSQDDIPAISYLERLLKHPVVASRYRGSLTEHVIGGIPLGPPVKTTKDNVMLVGDAAGQVKPTSGGGIYIGAVCAKLAGEIAAKASRKEARLGEYEKRWRNSIGRELATGMRIHKSLGKLRDNDLDEFIAYLNQPQIREIITEYGDMDHPSILFQKLINMKDKKRLIKLMGIAFKTLF